MYRYIFDSLGGQDAYEERREMPIPDHFRELKIFKRRDKQQTFAPSLKNLFIFLRYTLYMVHLNKMRSSFWSMDSRSAAEISSVQVCT